MASALTFSDFCRISNAAIAINKQAYAEGGLRGVLQSLPAPALGALLGGGAGLVTGAFSDKPGSMLRHGLVGAGLGGLAGWGGPKLMDYLGSLPQSGQGPTPSVDAWERNAMPAPSVEQNLGLGGHQPAPATSIPDPQLHNPTQQADPWQSHDPASWAQVGTPNNGPITF